MKTPVTALILVVTLLGFGSCAGPEPLQPESPYAAQRLDSWKVIGPGGGGSQFTVTISPHDPNTVLVRCDMTGAYITRDAGQSWRMFNLRSPIRFFVFDPHDAATIYAQSIGLFRSTDHGKSWELVDPQPDAVKSVEALGDHARDAILTEAGRHNSLRGLAVDPCDRDTLYGARNTDDGSTVIVSRDRGLSWEVLANVEDSTQKVFVNPRCTTETRTIYVAGAKSVSKITGSAIETTWAGGGIEGFTDIAAGFASESDGPILYATANAATADNATEEMLFISSDDGKSWSRALGSIEGGFEEGPNPPRFVAVATCLTDPSTAYASFRGLQRTEGTYFGIVKTTDQGESWQAAVMDSNDNPAPNLVDSWISRRFGRGWPESPFNLGVAPNDPNVCYGTDWGRTMRTVNGMETWEAVYSRETSPGFFSTNGLDVTTNYGIHFDPFDRRRIFISYTDIGLFRSEDGGTTWTSSTMEGVPRRWVNTTYWLEFDPEIQGRMWAVMSGVHDLPRPKMWLRQPVASFNGGVLRSDDGGLSWEACREGIPETAATHILLDPESPPSARTLYVAGYGKGVFKSVDGGQSWELRNNGIEGEEPFAWRFHLDSDGALYLVVARRSTDGSYGGPEDGAIYRSTDGAGTWTRLPLPEGLNGPVELNSDPTDPNRLYLAAWGRNTSEQDKRGGIWISEDQGNSWRRTLDQNQHLYSVTVDPRDSNVLYTSGFESSVWKSADKGETWSRIRGYNFKWGHRVVVDPYFENQIYVTTFGGSVWYGPADGDPDAPEDIVTPEVAYTK